MTPKPIVDPTEYTELQRGDAGYGSSCNRCGVFVVNEAVHTDWHAELKAPKAVKPNA